MATTFAPSNSSMGASTLGHLILEKLTRDNFLVWRAQVLPTIRGAQLTSYLDGSKAMPLEKITVTKVDKTTEEVENPSYVQWVAQNQQVLGYFLSTLSKEVLIHVVHLESAMAGWKAVSEMYSSQSKSRIVQIHTQLSREQKGDMTAAAYFTKMKSLADEMAVALKKLDDDDVVSYILAGLDSDYIPSSPQSLARMRFSRVCAVPCV